MVHPENHSSRDSLRRLAIDTGDSSRHDRKGAPNEDEGSSSMSPVSTHSRLSIDTSGLPDEEEPLLTPHPAQSRSQITHRTDSTRDPPPEYSPRPTNGDQLAPDQEPLRPEAATNYGTTHNQNPFQNPSYYSFPHTAPVTPAEPALSRSDFFSEDGKPHRRRKCCRACCIGPRWPPPRKHLWLAFGILIIAALLASATWQAISQYYQRRSQDADLIPWYTCPSADVKRTERFEFANLTSFTLQERLRNEAFLPGDLGGKVRVVGKARGQTSAVRVSIDMRSSYLTFLQHVEFEQGEDRLTINSPNPTHGKDPFGGEAPCTAINIVISVDPRLSDLLDIDAPHFSGIEISPDLALSSDRFFLHTSGGGRIARRAGEARFNPRHIDVGTVEGAIDAELPIVEQLWVASVTGPIRSRLTFPMDTSLDVRGPAQYHVNTAGGDVHVSFDHNTGDLPSLYGQASTVTGLLTGDFPHIAETNLTTVSGNMNIVLATYDRHTSETSTIFTDTVIGFTDLIVAQGTNKADSVGNMHSRHHSIGGGMRIRYPELWQGVAKGRTVLGAVDIAGPGVRETWRDGANFDIVKGDGQSVMEVESVSGLCEVLLAPD